MNVNGFGGSAVPLQRSGRDAGTDSTEQTGGTGSNQKSREMKGQSGLTMDDFLKLIAIQLQNQDMTNPMDNSEMMNQLVQMATVEAMSAVATQSSNSFAVGLLGQQVDVLYPDGSTMKHDTGTVTGVNMSTYPPTIYLDDKKEGYPMSTIAFIGQNKLDDEENPDGPGTENPDGPGTETPDTPEVPGGGVNPGDTGDAKSSSNRTGDKKSSRNTSL